MCEMSYTKFTESDIKANRHPMVCLRKQILGPNFLKALNLCSFHLYIDK